MCIDISLDGDYLQNNLSTFIYISLNDKELLYREFES